MKLFSFFCKRIKNASVGACGEDEACYFLQKKGYRILDRNARNHRGYAVGEIDIVARKKKKLVFVEVKTRVEKKNSIGMPPEMSITSDKLHKLERAIHMYRKEHTKYQSWPYQLDAVVVRYSEDGELLEIRHLEHIFL